MPESASSFAVRRQSGLSTILAGYPWFSDWGRDTMIALPGLTLVTGRHQEAREILTTFARVCEGGMIPNRFPDHGESPDYNSVDASLWFVHAVDRYLAYTGDENGVRADIWPVIKDIIEAAYDGGAEMIVTPCPVCQMNTEVYQDQINAKYGTKFNIPVVYYSQLMSVAYGGSAKDAGLDGQVIKAKKLEDIAKK